MLRIKGILGKQGYRFLTGVLVLIFLCNVTVVHADIQAK